jgi:hypothetical protein
MAKKNIVGIGGNIALPSGFNAKINSWSASHTVETVDTTGFADGGFRAFDPAITSLTGSAVGTAQYDAANSALLPTAVADGSVMALGDLASFVGTVTLTFVTGCTWACTTAIITGLSVSRPVDGKAEVTFNFQFSGPWTQTWDET